jgi:hypothetical protein
VPHQPDNDPEVVLGLPAVDAEADATLECNATEQSFSLLFGAVLCGYWDVIQIISLQDLFYFFPEIF